MVTPPGNFRAVFRRERQQAGMRHALIASATMQKGILTLDDTIFDPATATREARAVVSRYIHTLLYGGSEGGGTSGAEWDCKREWRRLGCSEAYIDSATAYARNTGDDVWQQRFLFEQR